MAVKNEIIEAVPNEVTEVIEEHKGFLYNKIWRNKLQEKVYNYCFDEVYWTALAITDNNDDTTLALYISQHELVPKYHLQWQDGAYETIESFYFETFSDLNDFLTNNPFYNLLIKQF